MFIQTEKTPNPATIKFIPGVPVTNKGGYDFKSPEDAANAPLAQRLFSIAGVKGVFFGTDFVSVSKSDDTDWNMLKPMILAALMEHLSTGQKVMDENATDSDSGEDDPIVFQIKELIATRVRPSVMMDGGDVVFDSFEDGVVYLSMRGACSGCPSASMTLKMGIENMLRHYIPEVTEVRQAGG
jgi:Fe-S cluster biogenesis protein NfuA